MTRYKLPEALGGGEYEARTDFWTKVDGHHDELRYRFIIPGVGAVDVPKSALTEVKPPLPEEPPVGSLVHLASYFGVYERFGRGWLIAGDATGKAYGWDHLLRLNSGDAPVRLVPDPFAEPVELPWRGTDKYSGQHVQVRASDANWQDDESSPPRMTAAWVTAGNSNVGSHITADLARDMARALWAAADQAERAS